MRFTAFIVLAFLCIGLVITCVIKIGSDIKQGIEQSTKEAEVITSRINTKVVIDKDTLTIVDYSMISKNYTLSNGTKLSFEYFK